MREELIGDELFALQGKLKAALSDSAVPASVQDSTVKLVMEIIANNTLMKFNLSAIEHHRNWPDCPSCVNAANRDMGAAHFFGIVAHDILGIPEERAVTEEEVIAALREIAGIVTRMADGAK